MEDICCSRLCTTFRRPKVGLFTRESSSSYLVEAHVVLENGPEVRDIVQIGHTLYRVGFFFKIMLNFYRSRVVTMPFFNFAVQAWLTLHRESLHSTCTKRATL